MRVVRAKILSEFNSVGAQLTPPVVTQSAAVGALPTRKATRQRLLGTSRDERFVDAREADFVFIAPFVRARTTTVSKPKEYKHNDAQDDCKSNPKREANRPYEDLQARHRKAQRELLLHGVKLNLCCLRSFHSTFCPCMGKSRSVKEEYHDAWPIVAAERRIS